MAETTVTSLPAFVPKLEEALRRELPGADVVHEHIRGTRYRFVVVWDRFTDVGHPERQRKVWDLATATVDKGDLFDVGMILTIAPDELPQE
jgi:hypothetical protein